MNRWEKIHWIIILVYEGLLCLSLVTFLKDPGSSPKIASFATALGPTIGTIILVGVTLVHIAGRRMRPACGLCVIAFLVAVSLVCLILAVPLMTT